jgi:cytosine/adenosine deaminase-related metal-dependent hydrolase
MDAILSATALGGDIMLHPNELGKVQPGFYADLIVVDGNPLDDISLLSGHEHIDMVMINGRVHKEAYKVSLPYGPRVRPRRLAEKFTVSRSQDAPTYYEPTRNLFDEADRLKEREKAAEGK